MTNYDVIIVGGSFAGLAVASRLRGKVLLIDRKEIGTGQTSACLTLLSTLRQIGTQDSVVQTYSQGYMHAVAGSVEYELPYPFCTFDYRRLCYSLARRTGAEIVRARVYGLDAGEVVTDRGRFRGKVLVDASGWRAVLARSLNPGFVDGSRLSFGIETVVRHRAEGMHFWMDPSVVEEGVAWLFPCGEECRIGVASYRGETRLGEKLSAFLNRLGLRPGRVHGGFLPWGRRPPTLGPLFLVGDAAGHCLPFTAEGIRPALYFGQRCGDIVQRVIDGEIGLQEGLQLHRESVKPFERYYAFLGWVQRQLPTLPPNRLLLFLRLIRHRPLWRSILRRYGGST